MSINDKGIVDTMKGPVFEPHAKLDTLYHFFFWAFFSTVSCLFSQARIRPMTPA